MGPFRKKIIGLISPYCKQRMFDGHLCKQRTFDDQYCKQDEFDGQRL
jgi:hypothetical protein